jgi:hypothetical protein
MESVFGVNYYLGVGYSVCMWMLLLLLFAGCHKYYVDVKKERIGRDSLASTFVGSPDPLQACPPSGEKLLVSWRLPKEAMEQQLVLVLKLVLRDYEEVTEVYPVLRRRGMIAYGLEERGIVTYKAEIQTVAGEVVEGWEQALWFSVIKEE